MAFVSQPGVASVQLYRDVRSKRNTPRIDPVGVPRLVPLLLLVALVGGCGQGSPPDASLCGAANSLGFIRVGGLLPETGSGAATSFLGSNVLGEIGTTYIAISTSCEFWSYSAFGSRGGVVRNGVLGAAKVLELSELLRLDTWGTLDSVHGVCCVHHFPPSSYHWGSDTMAWVGTASSAGPPPLPEDFPVDFSSLGSNLRAALEGLGSPAVGPIRYTAILVPSLSDDLVANAPSWPLETPIADLAATIDEVAELRAEGLPPPINRAEGRDADRLREIREAAYDGEFGPLDPTGFIAIREPDGSTYILYLRDVGTFESPEGVPARDPLSL